MKYKALTIVEKSGDQNLVFRDPGKYGVFLHNVSGTFTIDIQGEGVDVSLLGLYIGKKADNFIVHTIQKHSVPNSSSRLFIKGIFDDESAFRFQGLIRIEKDAQKSHAYQKNQNIILSPNVFIDSRPYLEILANDVFCTHGSTSGSIDKDQMRYAQTRGLTQQEARQILLDGFAQEVIDVAQQFDSHFQFSQKI